MSGTSVVSNWISLQGKVALVTGAAGGIGRSIVERLALAGARVAAVDRPGAVFPEQAALSVGADLGEPAEARACLEEVLGQTGGLDLFVHAAGITRDSVIWKMEESAWDEVIAVNLSSTFHLLKAVIPVLRARGGGSVVLLASINGERGKFGQANYAASKAGVIALARTAAREAGRFGIRVNAIAPGFIRTPMTAILPSDVVQQAAAETALGRVGEPDDVAGAVLFLCSELSRHVTGQVLRVDGGQLMA